MAALQAPVTRGAYNLLVVSSFSCLLLCLAGSLAGQASSPDSRADSLYEQFRNPPREYSLMPYWYWNGDITPADTREQIQAMMDQGVYRAVAFPWDGMNVRYLSEPYWRQMGAALDIAKELGFTLNVADEYDWPSGHAWDFGLKSPELSGVLHQHPEYRMKRLDYSENKVTGPSTWKPASSDPESFAVAARLASDGRLNAGTMRIIPNGWSIPAGPWLITTYRLVPAVGGHNTRVDLLNPDAVDVYLRMVYEEYARRFPQHLGSTLKMTLADHEGAYGARIAYTPALWSEFQRRHGYDLRSHLPLLVHDAEDQNFSRKVRSDYLDTVSQLYVDSFTGRVAEWCRRHNVQHGTSLYEEQMYIQVGQAGDMFRHWRAGSVVQIDALLERSRMPIDFKEAVSVAHFDRKPLVVENQGLQGHGTYFSLEKARLGTNMCLLWGADMLVPYFDYDPKRITWPPQWFLGQPFWPWFHHYAGYVRRAQFMNGQGEHVAPVLIYYPLETAFANSSPLFTNERHRDLVWNNPMDQTENFYTALQLELARGGWDYHIADSHYLENARQDGAALRIGDEKFRVLILPPMTTIRKSAAEAIRRFAEAGGKVLAIGDQPPELSTAKLIRLSARRHPPFTDRLNYMEQIQVPPEIKEDLEPLLSVLREKEPPQVTIIRGSRDHVFFSHRRLPGVDWYWFVNDTPDEREIAVRFAESGSFERWDAESGERYSLASDSKEVTLRFGPWDGFYVIRRTRPLEIRKAPERFEAVHTLPQDGWKFTPDQRTLRVPYATHEGNPVWLAPERLSNRKWWIVGPFPYDDHHGFFKAWGPEKQFEPEASYQGAFEKVQWHWVESPTYFVTLRDALDLPRNKTQGVFYAYAHVYSPNERDAQILTAFADSAAVWWNGQQTLFEHRHPKWLLMRDPWAKAQSIQVRKGWNSLLVKIGPSLMIPTAFMLRIVDASGATMRDLVFSSDRTLPEQSVDSLKSVQVRVPSGAVALADGTPVQSQTLTMRVSDLPEQPVVFRSGTVPFRLQSWTDAGLGFYSGVATYAIDFTLTADQVSGPTYLDLGEVGVTAEVRLNGKPVGSRVWRPYRFDITGAAVPGNNKLEVRVANSDAGWQSQGDTIYPKGSWGLEFKTERDRQATIRPNGLEGPVRILKPVKSGSPTASR